MKKYSKLFIFTLLAFFISSVSVLAREMNIDELGKEASKIQPDAGYVYILGEYAFTSNYNIQQEDLIRAYPKILTDLSQVNIYQIERKRDENYNPIGWKKGPNVLGKETIPETFNIKWIDMHHILEKSKAEVNLDIVNSEFSTYTEILKDKLKFDFEKVYGNGKLTYTNGKVSGLLLQNTEISLSETDKTKFKNPKYFFAYVLEIPNATKETTITTSGMNRTGKLKWENFDVTEAGKTPGIVVLVPVNPEDWQKDPNYTITIDLDGDKADKDDEYGKTEYKLDLSGLKFQQDSKATLNTDENNISQADKETLTNWGYNLFGENKHYNLSGSENSYKLTGKVEKQNLKENTFSTKAEDGYFFVFNLKKPDDLDKVPEGVKVTVKGQETLTYGKNYFNEDGVFTEIFKLKDKCEEKDNCKIEITVDWDGDGQEYLESQKITIDYQDLTFVKSSKFSILDVDKGGLTTNPLEENYGWKKPDNYSVKLNTEDSTVKVTGLLPILDTFDGEKNPFGDEDTTGYYLPFVIKTDAGKKTDNKNVTVQFIHDGEESKTLTAENFDGDDLLYILRHLDKDATDKTFKIVVDMDGNGEEYSPYEITFDWSGLTLQERTTASINIYESDVAEADKATLESYGYKFPNDIELSSDNEKHKKGNLTYNEKTHELSGTIKEQKLTGGFAPDELDSYFFTYTIKPNKVTDDIKVTITDFNGTTTYNKDNFENGTLTILHHIPLNKKTESNKKIDITVDADGDDNSNYKISEKYTIDYSDVDFVDLHTVTITDNSGTTKETKDIYDGEKFAKPSDPEAPIHEEHQTQYNTFDHWNIKESDEDKEYQFTEAVTKDITLYPIWEIDVEKYMSDVIKHINEKSNVKDKFKIEEETADSEEQHKLKIEILNKEQKIDEITDTDISSAIAHALASGEIDSVTLELGTNEKEFKKNGDTDENSIKTKVAEGIKEFIKKELDNNDSDKTLDDLYKKWNSEKDKDLTITIMPKKDVAVLPDKEEQTGIIYHVDFEEELKVSFDAGSLSNPNTEYVKTGDSIDELPIPVIPKEEEAYRKFVGWYKSDNTKVESLEDIKEDTTLTAHYKLNVDKFIEDVVKDLDSSDTTHSADFSSEFDIKQNSENKNEIDIDLKKANLPLNKLAETSIPGTIAYILEKDEIEDITLGFDGGEKKFSNETKEEVITEAKKLFNEKLSEKEAQATLDQLEYKDKNFTIEIGNVKNDTIELVDSDEKSITNKKYTFKFDSDFVVVDEDDDLGAQKISEVLGKDYSKIYVDGDVTETKTIDITATKDVTIEPIENNSKASGLMTAAETTHTITVNSGQNYVINVKAGAGKVTLSDLKITGGKFGEIKIEQGATVIANNIDVSGQIEPSQKSDDADDMHAAILVDGVLTASNIKNTDEKYSVPTIALVTSYSYPSNDVTGEDNDNGESDNVHPKAEVTITSNNMTRNVKYYIVKPNTETHIDSIEESYYGSFYYVNSNNSQIYFMTIIDRQKTSGGITFFKVYNYNDEIDINSLGYTESLEGKPESNLIFDKLRVESSGKSIQQKSKAQDVLTSHITNKVIADYKKKPVSALTVAKIAGLSNNNNNNNTLSGTLTTQDISGNYNIPVTITSNKFQEGVSTVDVIDPNGDVKNYTYSSSNTIEASQKTMNINLEAIKKSRITRENGKVYTIKVDVDGAENNYEEETYTIDYNNVNTLEEIINKAAENTYNVNSFTVNKNNKINGYNEKFTYEFNKETGLTHLKSGNGDNVEEYTFSLKYVGRNDSKVSVVVRKETNHEEGKVYLNDWEYLHPQQVGTAIHEVTMLTDVMGQTYINAIKKVQKSDEKEHTYIVTLNRDKYNDWVKKNYLSNLKYSSTEWALNETVTVEVELDNSEKYINSIKTYESSSNNTFNVSFSKINATNIEEPKNFLAKDGIALTEDDIIDFYNKGLKWWEDYTGATVYS